MEQHREMYEADVASFGVLLGVVAAAFIALGVIIYFFGEDQTSPMSAANNPPAQQNQTVTKKTPAEPSTIGQGNQ